MAEPGALALAVEHIADAQRRIDRQRQLVDELERDGHDTKEARALLETMLKLLQQMERHRDYLAEIAARPPAPK
jgi:hypothetical protein